jgi:hypothetical protein
VHFTSRDNNKISIIEDTNYPFDETIKLNVKATAPWKKQIFLKIPAWCKNYEIKLNGIAVKGSVNADGYLGIENHWNNDILTIFFGMTPKVIPVKDVYFQKTPLQAIECGPLLFAIKYPEFWTPVKGTPLTPLPDDWSWYNASYGPEDQPAKPSFYSLNLKELKGGSIIVKKQSQSSYPWDDSPLKLEVPMHRSKQAYPVIWKQQKVSMMPYGNPVTADSTTEIIEMVPYGSTNLRMSCFTVSN